MKYSIIVCAYNGEQYVDRCFTSIFNQTYSNFEVIAINDGSSDQTHEKMLNWSERYPERVKVVSSSNFGLSVGRNRGIKEATGDYILFLDIDDTIEPTMLQILTTKNIDNFDLIKISYNLIFKDGKKVPVNTNYSNIIFTGEEAFHELVSSKMVFEMAQLYAYRRKFWQENNFSFTKGRYHEDFGLIPYIIIKAKKVKLLNVCLYNYLQTDQSITRNNDYCKTLKRAKDILDFYIELKQQIENEKSVSKKTKELFLSFMANAVIGQYYRLHKQDKNDYRKKIIAYQIISDLREDSLLRKLKKIKTRITIQKS